MRTFVTKGIHNIITLFPLTVAPIIPVVIPLSIDRNFMVSSVDVEPVTPTVNSTTKTEIQL